MLPIMSATARLIVFGHHSVRRYRDSRIASKDPRSVRKGGSAGWKDVVELERK